MSRSNGERCDRLLVVNHLYDFKINLHIARRKKRNMVDEADEYDE
jgi:hypothetical protein